MAGHCSASAVNTRGVPACSSGAVKDDTATSDGAEQNATSDGAEQNAMSRKACNSSAGLGFGPLLSTSCNPRGTPHCHNHAQNAQSQGSHVWPAPQMLSGMSGLGTRSRQAGPLSAHLASRIDPVAISEARVKGEHFLASFTQANTLPQGGALRLPAAEGQEFNGHALMMDSSHPWQRCLGICECDGTA